MASVCEKLAQSLRLLPLLLLVLIGHICSRVGALTVDDLYPFDTNNGDTVLRPSSRLEGSEDLRSGRIPLPYPVPVFGDPTLSEAYVSINGHIVFRDPYHYAGFSDVSPFFTHLFATDYSEYDEGYSGDNCIGVGCPGLAYRVVSDAALLADITSDIRSAFPNKPLAAGFTAGSALIATWVNVSQCCKELPDVVHTFQAVIAFNTRTVFVGLLYPKLTFGGPNGEQQFALVTNAIHVLHGARIMSTCATCAHITIVQASIYNSNDLGRSFQLPTSFSTASFDELSNIGEVGKWWFGLDQIDTKAILGTFAYLDEPLPARTCSKVTLYADPGVDACGNPRVIDWDFDNDGAFDDKTDPVRSVPTVDLYPLGLTPGAHPIRAWVRSPSPCPGHASDPFVLNTTITLIADKPLQAFVEKVEPATGNPNPTVGETVLVHWALNFIFCNALPVTTVDCGAGSIAGGEEEPLPPKTCRYSTPGVKTITVNTTQNGLYATITTSITVVEYKPACLGQYPPGGRAIGRRGCSPNYWTFGRFKCNYPLGAGIKRSTKLWLAFASRAPQDAAVIRSIYGNRTMDQALRTHNNLADAVAGEAAAALLNALTLPYPYCPLTVKSKFRHALSHGVNSDEVRAVYDLFESSNSDSTGGCPLPYCE